MATKMTFTLDSDTAARIDRTAARLRTSKSRVVREAVRAYAAQVGRLTDDERDRMLDIFDRVVPAVPARPEAEVEREIADIRSARRRGGRGSGGS
jgi:metal-responsive CopG/Arc/MetJ family transcriptional regulator